MVAQQRHEHGRCERVAAEVVEKILVDADGVRQPKRLLHRGGHARFALVARRCGGRSLAVRLDLQHRQGAAIQFVARVARQRVERANLRGHHVRGQQLCQARLQRRGIQGRARPFRHHEADQRLAHTLALHRAGGLAHAGYFGEPRLDGLELDAVAADLDLRVDAPVRVEPPVRAARRKIAGPIQPAELRMDREFLRRQRRVVAIPARQAGAA